MLLPLLLLLQLLHGCQCQHPMLQFLSNDTNDLIVIAEQSKEFKFAVNNSAGSRGNVTFLIFNEAVAFPLNRNETNVMLHGDATDQVLQLQLQGRRMGWTDVAVNYSAEGAGKSTEINKWRIAVLRKPSPIQTVYRVVLICMVVVLVLGMGCAIDVRIVWKIVKRPIPLAIGWFTQFVVMPHLAFGLGQILTALLPNLENVEALAFGILTMGCSPGGGASNMWTLLFGGDLDLSMTMTFTSQLCALFMMPLWLFVYSRFYLDVDEVRVPLEQVAISLLQLVIPVLFGVLINYKLPKVAARVRRYLKPLTLVFVIFVICFGTWVNLSLYEMIVQIPIIIPFAALLPWLGFAFGYIIGIICQLKWQQAVAIALESGIQNIGIPILILQYSMPSPDGDLASIVPIIVVVLTPTPLYFIFLYQKVRQRLNRDKQYKLEDDAESTATEPSKFSISDGKVNDEKWKEVERY